MASEVNSEGVSEETPDENCETCYCSDCGVDIGTPKIQRSRAGYYIGTSCHCEPQARWSEEYYPSFQMAADALNNNSYTLRPNP